MFPPARSTAGASRTPDSSPGSTSRSSPGSSSRSSPFPSPNSSPSHSSPSINSGTFSKSSLHDPENKLNEVVYFISTMIYIAIKRNLPLKELDLESFKEEFENKCRFDYGSNIGPVENLLKGKENEAKKFVDRFRDYIINIDSIQLGSCVSNMKYPHYVWKKSIKVNRENFFKAFNILFGIYTTADEGYINISPSIYMGGFKITWKKKNKRNWWK